MPQPAPRAVITLKIGHAPPAICCLLVLAAAFIAAPGIGFVLVSEGVLVLAVLGAAAGSGVWLLSCLSLDRFSVTMRFCFAVGLGLGVLGLLTLAAGLLGVMSGKLAWGLVVLGWSLGAVRLLRSQGGSRTPVFAWRRTDTSDLNPLARGAVLACLVPLACVALLGASLPSGIIWLDEARGYDALEYHLQAPREYFDNGRITFLPHNVYASFPQQQEMLNLLLMHLSGDPHRAAIAAQLLHAACGILAVLALAASVGGGWNTLFVAVAVGGVPWLAYLGCLAYVELGVLLFAALAACLLIDGLDRPAANPWRTALAAGLFAGLAAGCKYTAAALVPAAAGAAWLVTMRVSPSGRAMRCGAFVLGAALTFSPWLARNAFFTGNPVYPFAYEQFGGEAWSGGQAEQWRRGHRLPDELTPPLNRARFALRESLGSHWFGYALFAAAAAGAVLDRSRRSAMLLIWAVLMFGIWVLFTHMPGRFLVPIIVPLGLLAGGFARLRSPAVRRIALTLAALAALGNGAALAVRLARETRLGDVSALDILGYADGSDIHSLNGVAPADANIWLVGDAAVFNIKRKIHYTVVFSRDPWIELCETDAPPQQCIDWLRRRGATHVLFSWAEIERLRRTYGFSDAITPGWVRELASAGMTLVWRDPAYGDLYELATR